MTHQALVDTTRKCVEHRQVQPHRGEVGTPAYLATDSGIFIG